MNRRTFVTAAAAAVMGSRAMSAQDGSRPSLNSQTVESASRYEVCRPGPADCTVMHLEAVAAARVPDSLAVVETRAGSLWGPSWKGRALPPLLELREYPEASPAFFAGLLRGLTGAGIEPWLSGLGRLLIPFESLQQRERLWRELGAARGWGAYMFAVYRPVPVLRSA